MKILSTTPRFQPQAQNVSPPPAPQKESAPDHSVYCEIDFDHKHSSATETKQVAPQALKDAYKNYEEISAELSKLEKKYPGMCKKVSLGKTHEGREIWALKVSKDVNSERTKDRPGIVVTGCHHAREWATTEVPLKMASDLLSSYGDNVASRNQIDNSELWFVPVVNPDGYEYSRDVNKMWRKNRAPVGHDACGRATDAIGTDLNRNYDDKNPDHAHIWRPVGDDPCSYYDDGRATSDNPRRDTFRGSSGASELETQAMLNLELNNPNMVGVLDYHSYGNMILYPWGNTRSDVHNKEDYVRVANKMDFGTPDTRYRVMQSVSLYPTSGGSHDVHHANGLFSMTMEIGRNFHPSASELPGVVETAAKAGFIFLQETLALAQAGKLPHQGNGQQETQANAS